mgnify:CR=1 FL=1
MITMKNITKILASLILIAFSITACVKGDFDVPELYDPRVDFEANMTIAELKAWYLEKKAQVGASLVLIEEDLIISGVIIANDESGNLYKKLVIQDATGGIELSLDKTSLHNRYKLGQRLFVKCNGIYIGDYNNLIQLGYVFNNSIGRLPEVYFNDHVFRDSLPGAIPEPKTITVDEFHDGLVSTLVRFEDASFQEVGLEWAPQTADATDRNLVDKNNKPLVVRTSKYSRFASDLIPDGYGSVTGVLGIFRTTYQLTIRDTSDLVGFQQGTPPPPPPPGDFIYPQAGIPVLTSLDEKFNDVVDNQDISIAGWTVQANAGTRYWRGRVFQNERYAQATSFNTTDALNHTWMVTPPVAYQAGLKLSFKSAKAYYVHDGLSVWILYNYDGTNHETAVWEEIDATLAGAANNDHAWVSSGEIDLGSILPAGYNGNIYIGFLYQGSPTNTTTYRIDDVLIDTNGGGGGGGGGTGSGTQADPYDIAEAIARQGQGTAWIKGYIVGTVKDGVNTVSSSADLQFSGPFMRNTHVLLADNASETDFTKIVAVNLPAGSVLRTQVNLVDNPGNLGKTLKVTGNLTTYFGIAGLRDSPGTANDFELEDNGGGGGGGGTTIFLETFSTTLGSFSEYSVTGDQKWRWDTYDGGCAVMSGFVGGSSYANEDWLISPAISLVGQTGVTMSFREAINYITSINDLQILISVDYSGSGNPNTNGNWTQLTGFNRAPGNSWTFIDSGDVSLAAYEGQTIYIAFKYVCGSSAASTWEVSRVEVKN